MRRLTLPAIFEKKLKGNQLEGSVILTLDTFSQLYDDPTRGLTFFPEYTGHGVDHVQRVINSSAALITSEAEALITAEDCALSVFAALLHDSAMHLTEDGFLTLIDPGQQAVAIPELDKDSWRTAWIRYFDEASRWDHRQLHRILGDESTIGANPPEDLALCVRRIEDSGPPDKWTTQYRKFIGEFIRRHHARLAHEFAILGFPAPSNLTRLSLLNGVPSDLADLAGLIARSHNMGLRETFSYLKRRWHGRGELLKSHPIYLMALLRIADYLEIDADRAPAVSLQVRSLRNSISRQEWATHSAITDVRADEDDREAIFVLASPPDAKTYRQVTSLLKSLQSELDTSWAVLGEVYSRSEFLNRLTLRLRRIYSNIDNLSEFAESITYIPSGFMFKSAGSALLNKLTGPLYEDHPEVGVRELLQNAIDAVNERRYLESKNPKFGNLSINDDQDPIRIRLEQTGDSTYAFLIEDDGIGMDETILSSYFFCVGTSFRESDAWRRTYAPDGTPTIVRSGRFGIGILAAFLLGSEIAVETRHVTALPDQGIRFNARIDDEIIEATRCVRGVPGTTICIRIDEPIYLKLKEKNGVEWDWYRWSVPQIRRSIDGDVNIPKLTSIPEPNIQLPLVWNRLTCEDFEDVIWTYADAPRLVCNGINIGSSASSRGYSRHLNWEGESSRHDATIAVEVPSVAVTDRKGKFPLNLQRFSLMKHRYPFADRLMADAARDYLAFSLVFAPQSPPHHASPQEIRSELEYPGRDDRPSSSFSFPSQWFYTTEGSGVLHRSALCNVSVRKAKLLLSLNFYQPNVRVSLLDGEGLFLGYLDVRRYPDVAIPLALSHVLTRTESTMGPNFEFFDKSDRVRILLPAAIGDAFAEYRGQFDLADVHRAPLVVHVNEQSVDSGVRIWTAGTLDEVGMPLDPVVLKGVAKGDFLYAEVESPGICRAPTNAFADSWRRYSGDEIIPFNLIARREKFAFAYAELKEMISKWETIREMGTIAIRKLFRARMNRAEPLRPL